MEGLDDPDLSVRLRSVQSLFGITGPRPEYLPTLLFLLEAPEKDGWYEFEITSASNLLAESRINTPECSTQLLNLANNRNLPAANREGALRALMSNEPDPVRVAALVDLWRDEALDVTMRLKLIKYLLRGGYTSDDFLPFLEKSLTPTLGGLAGKINWTSMPEANVAADCLVLGRQRSEKARSLFEASLKEDKGLIRLAVLTALLEIGEEPEQTDGAFSPMLSDDDRSVREIAVCCLAADTKNQLRWAEPLLKIVENPNEDQWVGSGAARALRRYGKSMQPIANRLVPLLRVKGGATAEYICDLVAELDYRDHEVHPLVAAFESPDAVARLKLARLIIQKLPRKHTAQVGESVIGLLEHSVMGDNGTVALSDSAFSDAIRVVAELGNDGRNLMPRLKALRARLQDERSEDRRTKLEEAVFLIENDP